VFFKCEAGGKLEVIVEPKLFRLVCSCVLLSCFRVPKANCGPVVDPFKKEPGHADGLRSNDMVVNSLITALLALNFKGFWADIEDVLAAEFDGDGCETAHVILNFCLCFIPVTDTLVEVQVERIVLLLDVKLVLVVHIDHSDPHLVAWLATLGPRPLFDRIPAVRCHLKHVINRVPARAGVSQD
jgi:hypothetical protein